jgi:hypothetical protein
VDAREVLAELDRLGISIFYRQPGPGRDPGAEISVSVGRERAYPELLRLASFEPSRHTPGTYLRRPGGAA